jgi:hypothetical protein
MPTVYIPDPVELLHPFDDERAAAEASGAEFVLGDEANPTIRDAEIILTTWIRFSPEVIRTLERCQLIVRYGIRSIWRRRPSAALWWPTRQPTVCRRWPTTPPRCC